MGRKSSHLLLPRKTDCSPFTSRDSTRNTTVFYRILGRNPHSTSRDEGLCAIHMDATCNNL